MTTTYSANLNLAYQGVGDNSNTWGTILNTSALANIDQALGGPFTVSVAGSSDYTISATNALNFYHNPTGVLTGNINYVFPASCARILLFKNSTTGSFSLTVKSSGGTGVIVPQGAIVWVYINSTGNVASLPFGTTTEQNLASSSTCDLGSTGSNMVLITGTTTITALGSSAVQTNPIYFVRFNGALTLTYNASSLILPGTTSITTAANDTAIFEYQGSGNWQCLMYQKANGQSVAGNTIPFSDASALVKNSSDTTKLAILSAASISTGTTRTYTLPDATTTLVGTGVTQTLTNKTLTDSTTFIADDGDATKKLAFQCSSISTSTTRTVTIPDKSGTMAMISDVACVQHTSTQTGAVASGSTVIPWDDTIPQSSEGDQYMTLAITPTSSTNKLVIEATLNVSISAGSVNGVAAIFQDAGTDALAASQFFSINGLSPLSPVIVRHVMTAGTTSSTTFKVRVGGASGTITFNGSSAARKLGGVMASSIHIYEYTA